MKFYVLILFCGKAVKKLNFLQNLKRTKNNLRVNLRTFVIISHRFLKMRIISAKFVERKWRLFTYNTTMRRLFATIVVIVKG